MTTPMFEIALNVRDINGNLLLALEDDANGFYIRGGGLPAEERTWKGDEVSSPWVDGAADGLVSLERTEVSVLVKVFGDSWAQVEGRHEALLAATSARVWLLEQVVEGVSKVWRAGPVAVLNAPVTAADLLNKRRYVVLTFKVQPSPTVSGVA